MRKIEDLNPYHNNPRINDHAITKTAAAIKRFGFRVPILIKANGDIIDGHLRYKSALSLDLLEIPCLVADDMTDSEIKAFRISVNKLAELAEWDDDLLHQELLNISDEDIELIGFDKKIIKQNNKAELKKLICKPPDLVWILICTSINEYGKIQGKIEEIGNKAGVKLETIIANDSDR